MGDIAPTTPKVDDPGTARQNNLAPFMGIRIGEMTSRDLGIQNIVLGGKVEHDIEKISLAELHVRNFDVRLVNDVMWSEGQVMQLFLGYANSPDRVQLHGRFKMSRPRFSFKGQNRIIIQGLGDGVEMTRVAKRRVFENMTYDQIVSQIASDYGLGTEIAVRLNETIPSVTQAGVSDYAFLKELAKRSGVDFFVAGERLFFMAAALRTDEQPTIIDIQSPDVDTAIFMVNADGKAAEVSSSPINPRTGEFEVIASQFIHDDYLDLDVKGQVKFQEMAEPRVMYVDGRGNLLSPSALQTTLDAEANKRKNIVKCRVTVSGAENMKPRQTVAFFNCGSRFMGPYYITKVTHEIMSGRFTTSFEGVRATTGEYQHLMIATGGRSIGGTAMPLRDASHLSEREEA